MNEAMFVVPEAIMNGLVAGACNVPNALFVPFRLELIRPTA
jgi:hypothetical protein